MHLGPKMLTWTSVTTHLAACLFTSRQRPLRGFQSLAAHRASLRAHVIWWSWPGTARPPRVHPSREERGTAQECAEAALQLQCVCGAHSWGRRPPTPSTPLPGDTDSSGSDRGPRQHSSPSPCGSGSRDLASRLFLMPTERRKNVKRARWFRGHWAESFGSEKFTGRPGRFPACGEPGSLCNRGRRLLERRRC